MKNEDKSWYNSYFKGKWYTSGDRAVRDHEGYYWFIGRADDVINTSGERVGPFEVESALVAYPDVIEAGVIGKPDVVRGEIIKAFVVLKPGVEANDELVTKLQAHVKKHLMTPYFRSMFLKIPQHQSKMANNLMKSSLFFQKTSSMKLVPVDVSVSKPNTHLPKFIGKHCSKIHWQTLTLIRPVFACGNSFLYHISK